MRWLLAAFLVWTQAAAAMPPDARLSTLSRGVNVIDITKSGKPLPDMDAIAHAGFRHVRIFVDPAWVPGELPLFDRVLQSAWRNGLGVILCMHSYEQRFADDPALLARWTAAWRALATRYVWSDPNKLFFELVNEPTMEQDRWVAVQEQLRSAVRRILPEHTLLLTGQPVSTSAALVPLPISSDPNVLYTFHLYAPMIFTHQGADWDPQYAPLRDLQYPPTEPNLTRNEHAAAGLPAEDFAHYRDAGRGVIDEQIAIARDWAAEHRVAVMVTEFGVYRAAPAPSRARWLHDARTGLEAARIGWTVWEWDGGFGVQPDVRLGCAATVTRALGLCH